MKIIPYEQIHESNLIVDAVYKSGITNNFSSEPLSKILGISNQGGIRYIGSIKDKIYKLVMLFTTFQDLDWPDVMDKYTGRLIYFGDNKEHGNLLHDALGNKVLADCFDNLHRGDRNKIPPFFIFSKAGSGRDVIFRGLAVPGAQGLTSNDDLVAVWKIRSGERFQNYKAIFTILDEPIVLRSWLNDLYEDNPFSRNCPESWLKWVQKNIYTPLQAEKITEYRTKFEQIPSNGADSEIINTIYTTYKSNPFAFEKCATEVVKLMDKNFISCELTRPWVDGGRDALGKYRIGNEDESIQVDFALEAKYYGINQPVGVKETSRLISRLRHRQFGVLVTTSFVHRQAYKEIKEDGHPIIIISAIDIISILKQHGYSSNENVKTWLCSIN